MERQKILIIDDNEEKRETLVDYVLMLGHEALEAENGLLGLAAARLQHPDLILLDLTMPKMNGMQFLAERRRDPEVQNVPVIVITARDSSEYDVADCIREGAEDILPMPPEYELLKARIENCLVRRVQQKREAELRGDLERLLLSLRDAERDADRLLRSIFPKDAARELKETHAIAPRRHDDVAVMFCDVVGFTPYCDTHPPDEVVSLLELLVEEQERLAEQYGVEKIKTIGDAFMAVAGLRDPGDEALLNCVRCGLEFARCPGKLRAGWQVRVGIHAGPVVAGKIGRTKFGYDVWGDTVNVAARIERQAAPETVLVSAAVWQRVGSRCRGASQGSVALKGKGEIELFRVDEVVAGT
jgi:class 3 adenylate cyclase